MIYNVECLEQMKHMADCSIDAIITDPPYGTTACKWDSIIDFDLMWEQLNRLIKPTGAIVLFGSEPFSSALRMSNIKMFRYDWYWESNRCANYAQAPYMPLKNIEVVSVFSTGTIASNSKIRAVYNPQGLKDISIICKGRSASNHRPNRSKQKDYTQTKTGYPTQKISFNKDHRPVHPTQKPVALMEYLIKTYTNENETVLDFTMGSGTTGVACSNLNREFIGIERDEKYFEIAKKRINESRQKIELF